MKLLKSIQRFALLASCAAILGGAEAANAELIPSLFSTGVDNNGVPLPDGQIGAGAIGDPHYSLASVPPGGTTRIDVFTFLGQWVARDAISTWIAPNSVTTSGQPQDGPVGDYDYRTTFNLAGFNPATASITGKWAADNYGFDILINGQSTGNTTQTTTSDSFVLLHDFSISSNFGAGINTLDFLVRNSNGPGPNATGLRVEILDATADPTSTPEPSSLIMLSSFLGMAGIGGMAWIMKRKTLAPAHTAISV
jgi:hypothetical protein